MSLLVFEIWKSIEYFPVINISPGLNSAKTDFNKFLQVVYIIFPPPNKSCVFHPSIINDQLHQSYQGAAAIFLVDHALTTLPGTLHYGEKKQQNTTTNNPPVTQSLQKLTSLKCIKHNLLNVYAGYMMCMSSMLSM